MLFLKGLDYIFAVMKLLWKKSGRNQRLGFAFFVR